MADDTQKTITIQGASVNIAAPYAAGHQITEAEAKALNQVRAENIRNNMAKTVKDLIKKAGSTEVAQNDIQSAVSKYDGEYEFTLASVGGGRSLDPVEKAAKQIARNYIAGQLKAEGWTQKSYKEKHGENSIEDKIVELMEHPKVVAAAKKQVEEHRKLAESIQSK